MTEFNDDQMYLYPDPDRDHLHIVGELSLDCEAPVDSSDSYFVPVISDVGKIGPKGSDGKPAGFGSITATVDQTTGTPSVTVTASGPNTAKNFNFAFSNLKGEPFEFDDFTTSQLNTLRANIVGFDTYRYKFEYSDFRAFYNTGNMYIEFKHDSVFDIDPFDETGVEDAFVFLCFKNGLLLQHKVEYQLNALTTAEIGSDLTLGPSRFDGWQLYFDHSITTHSLPVQGDIYDIVVIKLKEPENQGD